MQKVRFGFIGAGSIAKKALYPALKNSQFGEIYAVAGKDAERAKSLSPSGKFYTDYQKLIDDPNVEAVYISLPNSLHIPWSIKAMQAGKHVLCEKSSTVSYDSAKRMVSVAKQNNVRLMEGFMFRFHPSHQKVKEIIKMGNLGKLFSFYGKYGFSQIPYGDIRHNKNLGGGILNDAGCYPICASRIVFGKEPESVLYSPVLDKKSGVDIRGTLFLKYGDGEFAQMEFGYGLYYQSKYEIWGDKGHLRLSRAYNIPPDMKASLLIESINKKEILIKPTNHFRLMFDSFSKQVLNVSKAHFNFESDLLLQAKVMDAARNSHLKNKPVSI